MNDHLNQASCLAFDRPWTWQDKLRSRLFPIKHCFAPEAPADFKDCINHRAITRFGWLDRLRILWTGVIVTHSRIVTQNEVGNTVSAAECYVGTSRDLSPEG